MSIPDNLDTLTSGLASIFRLPFATATKIFRLYDMEGNSDCRLVRERITELDLCVDVVIPAGRRSRALTDRSYEYYIGDASGISVIPSMMVSEEDGVVRNFVGSEDILEYLSSKFGPRNPIVDSNDDEIKKKVVDALVLLSEPLPSLLRLGRGQDVAGCALSEATPRPVKPLILYSYEGNQFCRLVREVLCELDIPYRLVSSGKGSQQRAELAQVSGSTQCPYLVDPNTKLQMAESKAIIEYLYQKYAIYTPPNEALGMISGIITPLLKPLFKVLAPLQAGSNRENKREYTAEIEEAKAKILEEISSEKVVIYTYSLSPFCTEALKVLDRLEIPYKEISLGLEWVPFLIQDKGAQKRVALGEVSGQTSLPNIFVNGKSIGGLYEGLLPALEKGTFQSILNKT
eukprot:CAMPEP_0176499320 /NCGR_PEP_ID=MMETSP0200_2-20121128/12863_1 /TAXON_ID=947934 /ORGANISM="Chaetoceros sp., Strain GSL56" /LENGTH=401 /DNA_ID=CAMNT_0017897729 /DNA_START=208 /DNA_END=1409 /DNA_ORIENTATION=-